MSQVPRYRRVPCPNYVSSEAAQHSAAPLRLCGNYPFSFVGTARQCWACDWLWDPDEAGREIIGYREEKE